MSLFICIGTSPIDGCGKILTDEEREYYEVSCEACTRLWDQAIDAWRRGGENKALDQMFEVPRAPLDS